jgi:hypothetical protein
MTIGSDVDTPEAIPIWPRLALGFTFLSHTSSIGYVERAVRARGINLNQPEDGLLNPVSCQNRVDICHNTSKAVQPP